MKKTWTTWGLCAVLVGIAMTGCSRGGKTDTADQPGPIPGNGSGKQTSFRYGYWGKRQEDMLEVLVKQFEKDNPDIKIEMELTPVADYWTKLEESAGGGSAPDVFWMNGSHMEMYAENEMLLPLDDTGVDFAGYPETLVDLYTYEGRKYAVPKDFDTVAVWYNKELFDNTGIEYPTADWTWEDMVGKAEALTDAENGICGIVAPLDPQSCFFNTMFANGGYVLSDDKKKMDLRCRNP